LLSGEQPFWRGDAAKIAAFALGTIFFGALLTPWLHAAGTALHASGRLEGKPILGLDLHDELRRADLARYFNRAMLLAALLCLWPTVRWIGAGSPREFLALEPNPRRWRDVGAGFGLAAGGLFLLGWGLLAAGVFVPNPKRDPLAEIVASALVSGFAVAWLEEFFFRGCLLGLALRTSGRRAAAWFVAVFFAAVHFLKPPEGLVFPDPVTWSSGFWMVGKVFGRYAEPQFVVAEFATLLLVGWILGQARLATRSLWLSVGLHAGWVFGIKAFGAWTRRGLPMDETLPWIGADLKSGLGPVLVVALTGGVLWWARGLGRGGTESDGGTTHA
jgi:membrane protease YdiL (CAAX protease family)